MYSVTMQQQMDPYHFHHEHYKGADIYWNNLPWAPCIHIGIGVMVGTVDDPDGKEGLSHFLEHLPFDGSTNYPSIDAVKAFNKEFLLDSFNARTSHNSTYYHCRFLPKHTVKALEGLRDVIFEPLLTDTDISRERNIITEEAWGRLRNEQYIAFLKRQIANTYHNHPLGRTQSPLGWPETIAAITPEDIRNWHKKQYHRNNVIIVLAGACTEKDIVYIKTFIDNIPADDAHPRTPDLLPPPSWPKPNQSRITDYADKIGIPSKQASLLISRVQPSTDDNEVQNVASRVLNEVLFTELREKRAMVYSVSMGRQQEKDLCEYYIAADLSEENIEEAERSIYAEIEHIISGKYKHIFDKEKQIYIEHLESTEFSSNSVMRGVFHDIEYFGEITSLEGEKERAKKVAYEHIQDFLKNVFAEENRVVSIILPSSKE